VYYNLASDGPVYPIPLTPGNLFFSENYRATPFPPDTHDALEQLNLELFHDCYTFDNHGTILGLITPPFDAFKNTVVSIESLRKCARLE
jgi:hypothetical protein